MKMRAGRNSSADAGPPTDCCSSRKMFLQHLTTQLNLSWGAFAESIPNISKRKLGIIVNQSMYLR
jgi:hypothetical protein